MSEKLKNSDKKAIDRPFEKTVLEQAKKAAGKYQVVLKHEDGEWYGHGLELPGAWGDGKTPAAAVVNTQSAMVSMVAYMIEKGQPIPAPASEGNRNFQINIRVTSEEKEVLESRSKGKGFRGLSDYIRSTILTN